MMLTGRVDATHLVADIQIQRLAGGEYTRKHLPAKALQHLLPSAVLQRQQAFIGDVLQCFRLSMAAPWAASCRRQTCSASL